MPPFSNMTSSIPTTVLDLPQIYTQPSAAQLLTTLELLAIKPTAWDPVGNTYPRAGKTEPAIDEEGIPKYLTGIVSCPLSWIDEERKEQIWEMASRRLSERAGRTGDQNFSFFSSLSLYGFISTFFGNLMHFPKSPSLHLAHFPDPESPHPAIHRRHSARTVPDVGQLGPQDLGGIPPPGSTAPLALAPSPLLTTAAATARCRKEWRFPGSSSGSGLIAGSSRSGAGARRRHGTRGDRGRRSFPRGQRPPDRPPGHCPQPAGQSCPQRAYPRPRR